ncbi:MAG: c-type cytochrome [Gammaproteobacteria bacterium]|mgnify:FL=1|jgi:mono/diheme cytochrome c family protein|nr:c-type cytochrome [Gammaproteobacteria bacterium]MBT3860074.1 c-type cytochrome [Gammaproteobacteria bacterium]MBT3987366.1 c-type cytochrome [Gammaproteobacteria bacterium]MBT4581896.1 c-type cytochrome [Gammaproteobacteria bacterium]MBT4659756.1 c-type cytochrome [Gammaproteobacteria bacterium]
MKKQKIILVALALISVGIAYALFAVPPVSSEVSLPTSEEAIARGAYLVSAGGCISCHRAEGEETAETFSGGFALETDFGTFYAPNITPDAETGIGNWTARDFLLALKHGRSPGGGFYYPAFPYRAYAGLSDEEVLDIGAYLMSLDAVSYQAPEAETASWLFRWTVAGWNFMADRAQPAAETFNDELVARGAYLANNLGHCSECHTPRNSLGILDTSRAYTGATLGEETVEAIDAEALAEWTINNVDLFLLIGLKPNGEFVGGDMNDVIEHNTSKLTDEDRDALAAYFKRGN